MAVLSALMGVAPQTADFGRACMQDQSAEGRSPWAGFCLTGREQLPLQNSHNGAQLKGCNPVWQVIKKGHLFTLVIWVNRTPVSYRGLGQVVLLLHAEQLSRLRIDHLEYKCLRITGVGSDRRTPTSSASDLAIQNRTREIAVIGN